MLTVGDKFPAFHLTAVKGGPEGLGGPGASFTEISRADSTFVANTTDALRGLRWCDGSSEISADGG